MSTAVMPGVVCNNIEQELQNTARGAYGATKRTRFGLLDAVRSDLNRDASTIEYDQGNGKHRDVTVKYDRRILESAVDETCDVTCTTSNESGRLSKNVTVSLYAEYAEKVQEEYLAQICKGSGEYARMLIDKSFNAINGVINGNLISICNTDFGINVATGTNARRDIQVFDGTNNNALLEDGWAEFIDGDLEDDNKFSSNPIIVGQGIFSRFHRRQKIACCNDAGQNPSELSSEFGYGFFKDQDMNTKLGTNELIVFEPGSLEMLTYHQNRSSVDGASLFQKDGAYGAFTSSDGMSKGMIVDPVTLMVYDLYLAPDHCTNEWYWRISLHYDLFTLPTDMYESTDPLNGTNGLLHYRATNS